jgi:hypothetical protein
MRFLFFIRSTPYLPDDGVNRMPLIIKSSAAIFGAE